MLLAEAAAFFVLPPGRKMPESLTFRGFPCMAERRFLLPKSEFGYALSANLVRMAMKGRQIYA